MRRTFVALVVLGLTFFPPVARAQAVLPTIAEKTAGMECKDGFIPLYWDARAGKLWLEIPQLDTDLIYAVSLPTGIGSNDIGLDRGQRGETRIVRFERTGPRVLLVQPNLDFRASSTNPDEVLAVGESFARSVLFGFTVAAESGGHVLVDATDFALHDAHGVTTVLKQTHQGDYRLDTTRSALYLPSLKVFPRNSEIEATLTFASDTPGKYVRDVTPTPEAITVRERQSFIQVPDPGFVPRRNDPRSGFHGITYADEAVPLGQPLAQRFIARHRLEKKDPSAALSEPVKPIVYYVDRGAPEPIRTALMSGASWWNAAFEAAGYRNAFRVEVMPVGADPQDVRYNTIQWVHRATRGYSYGASVLDPRTGEIIKGNVTLGSLRGRQDFLIGEALLSPYVRGSEHADEVERFVLARLRQLAAHEVGHTLGLVHNYISSAQGRSSVMDYPQPLVNLRKDGTLDMSAAYPEGIGAWDKVAITYGYATFVPGTNESSARTRVLASARARGLYLLTDQDARPPGSAHPQTHLWDNGIDATRELERVMTIRRAALNRFGEHAIQSGMPLATIEEALVPLYLYHRYQVEAATKVVGGQWYNYAMRGDGVEPLRVVSAADQRRALQAILKTVAARELTLPPGIIAKIPPRPFGYEPHRELFTRSTGLVFDTVAPAASAADATFALLFNSERAARLIEQHALDPRLPDLSELLQTTDCVVFAETRSSPYEAEIARAVQRAMIERLMTLARTAPMPQVRAVANQRLTLLRDRFRVASAGYTLRRAHESLIAADIDRFFARPWQQNDIIPTPEPPPGAPIGEDDE